MTLNMLFNHLKNQASDFNDAWWLSELFTSQQRVTNHLSFMRVYHSQDHAALQSDDYQPGEPLERLNNVLRVEGGHVKAAVLCHAGSCKVDPAMLDSLGAMIAYNAPFLRHHFDYARFEDEENCPMAIKERMAIENHMQRSEWRLSNRWTPIRQPGEAIASFHFRQFDDCISILLGEPLGNRSSSLSYRTC